jgi:hypothetical protein
MITPKDKAFQILSEWNEMKHAHFIHQIAELHTVLDVEFEKEKLHTLASSVCDALINPKKTEADLSTSTALLEHELTIFREKFFVDFLTSLRN